MNIGVLSTYAKPVIMACTSCGREDLQYVAAYEPTVPGTAYSGVANSNRWHQCKYCGANWVSMSDPPWVARELEKAKKETDFVQMNLRAAKKKREEDEAIPGPPPVIVCEEDGNEK